MNAPSSPALRKVLAEAGLEAPDGRPLHGYPLSAGQLAELEGTLRSRLAPGSGQVPMPAAFVLWAAEHIRSKFPGGQLTWEFVLKGLGLREDRDQAVDLVENGLRWWRREVRISEAGRRMSLYSLMAEGGLPGVEASAWSGYFVPAGTPQSIIQRLNRELVRVFNSPDIRDLATSTGTEVVAGRPDEFAAFIRAEITKWGGIIKDAGIKPQ